MRLASILAALLLAAPAWAQTQIYQQSFEDGTGYSTSIAEFTDTFDDFFIRTDTMSTGVIADDYEVDGFDGDFIFAAQDIDGEGAELPVRLVINDIDISGFENLSFSGLFAEDDDGSNQDWDEPDFVHIKYRIDSDSDDDLVNLLWFENDGSQFNSAPLEDTDFDGTGDGTALTSTFAEFTKAIAGTGSTLDIVVIFSLNSGDEDIAIDNFRVSGTEVAAGEPEITASRPNIAFGSVDVGSSAQETVTITNDGDADLIVSDASIVGQPSFTIVSGGGSFVLTPSATRDIVVQFAPTSAGFQDGLLNVSSNDADESTISIDLSGTGTEVVTPEPEIEVTPLAVDFGSVDVGSSAEQMVTISNTGDAELTLGYSISGDGFAIVGGPSAVAAGGSEMATISFTPTAAGAAAGTFTITSNDADEGTVEVSLTGTGNEVDPGTCEYAFGAIALSGTELPSSGGQLRLKFEISNLGNASVADVDVWGVASNGESSVFIQGPRTPSVSADAVYRAGFYQRVPDFIEAGTYTYTLFAGTFDSDDPDASAVCDSEAFTVTKGDPAKANASGEMVAEDWADVEIQILDIDAPEAGVAVEGDEVRVGPNPVRGEAAFTFAVEAASTVRLAVYDTRGREVAVLVDGPLGAGQHTATLREDLPERRRVLTGLQRAVDERRHGAAARVVHRERDRGRGLRRERERRRLADRVRAHADLVAGDGERLRRSRGRLEAAERLDEALQLRPLGLDGKLIVALRDGEGARVAHLGLREVGGVVASEDAVHARAVLDEGRDALVPARAVRAVHRRRARTVHEPDVPVRIFHGHPDVDHLRRVGGVVDLELQRETATRGREGGLAQRDRVEGEVAHRRRRVIGELDHGPLGPVDEAVVGAEVLLHRAPVEAGRDDGVGRAGHETDLLD
jgi:hypothetical protein